MLQRAREISTERQHGVSRAAHYARSHTHLDNVGSDGGPGGAARRAEAWFGEPFLHPGEDAGVALAPDTARRRALDDALAEIEDGRKEPSPRWKVRYGLMLGLERVLAAERPQTAAGTDLRRHQVDALAGMLTELIAANQREADENGNGNGGANGQTATGELELEEDEDDEDAGLVDDVSRRRLRRAGPWRCSPLPLPAPDGVRQDDRRGGLRRGRARSRHPHPARTAACSSPSSGAT